MLLQSKSFRGAATDAFSRLLDLVSPSLDRARRNDLALLKRRYEERMAELRDSQDRFKAIFDHTFQFTGLTNLEGTLLEANQTSLDFTGMKRDEIIGKPIWDLPCWHPETRVWLQDAVCAAAAGIFFREEVALLGAGGVVATIDFSLKPVRDDFHKVIYLIPEGRDITDRKRAELLELEQAGLKSSVRAMEQVLGVVGHELRTPLAGLRAISEYLLNDRARDAEQYDGFLNAMHDEVVRMADTVDDLLEAARLNSGHARWRWSTVQLRDVCRDAIDTIRPLMKPNSLVQLAFEVESGIEMLGDADALRRMILNIIGNSRKHTTAGCIKVVARLCGANPRWAEITVFDTGCGIAPENIARLGEAFALNSGAVGAGETSGTGLGLAICKGIAAAHGGQLSISSIVGQGTSVTAPLRADLPEPIQDGTRIQFPTSTAAMSGAAKAA